MEADRFFAPQHHSWNDSSALDEKIHSIFEILPSSIGQYKARLFRDNTHLTDTQHLYSYLFLDIINSKIWFYVVN